MTLYDAFPDSEAFVAWAIRSAAIAGLNGVYSSLPKNPDYPVVVVGRIGGPPIERHRLDSPSLQIDVWGGDQATTHDIAQEARVAVHSLEGGTYGIADDCPVSIVVASVEDSLGLTFMPDPTSGRDRYIFGLRLVTHVGPELS